MPNGFLILSRDIDEDIVIVAPDGTEIDVRNVGSSYGEGEPTLHDAILVSVKDALSDCIDTLEHGADGSEPDWVKGSIELARLAMKNLESTKLVAAAPSPSVEGELPRTKEQERWWNYGYLKGFFDCNKSLAVSDASPAGETLAELDTNVLNARRRLTDAMHAMHVDQSIVIDSRLAKNLDSAWDIYDATIHFRAVSLAPPTSAGPSMPTSAEINALPERWRRYIQEIETRCDPTGEVQTIACLRDQVRDLTSALKSAAPSPAGGYTKHYDGSTVESGVSTSPPEPNGGTLAHIEKIAQWFDGQSGLEMFGPTIADKIRELALKIAIEPKGGTLAEAIRRLKNPYNGPITSGAYGRALLDAAALAASTPAEAKR